MANEPKTMTDFEVECTVEYLQEHDLDSMKSSSIVNLVAMTENFLDQLVLTLHIRGDANMLSQDSRLRLSNILKFSERKKN